MFQLVYKSERKKGEKREKEREEKIVPHSFENSENGCIMSFLIKSATLSCFT